MAGLFLLACGTKKAADAGDATKLVQVESQITEVKDVDAPASIDNIKRRGNYLLMDVTFAGSCPEDSLGVYGSPVLTKSMPPQRTVYVSRIRSGHSCNEFITKRIRVDLRPLAYKQEPGSEIILNINGVQEPVKYVYE